MFCGNCGKPLRGGPFCPFCGTKQPEDIPAPEAIIEPVPLAEVIPEPVVSEPEPVIEPEPVAAPETVLEAEPVQVAEPAAEAPVVETKPKKKKSAKPFIIIGAVVLGIVLLAGAVIAVLYFIATGMYNSGKEAIENGEYEEAYETFTSLKSFKDSEYWAEYAQLEIDYQTIDELAAEHDFDGVIEILDARSDFFGKDDKGKEAKALMEEYKVVKDAYAAKDSENYAEAAEKFDSLVLLDDKFGFEANICRAYNYEIDQDWISAITDLYGIQIGDLELNYLDDPQDPEQQFISDTYFYTGNYVYEPQAVADVMKPETEEEIELVDTAINGLWYNYGYNLYLNYEFEEAIETFDKLGDFEDSASMKDAAQSALDDYTALYDEAMSYYNKGEYYKALEIFQSMPRFKDSSDMASACYQPLPETGDYRIDDGSIELDIYAPSGSQSVFVRVYDSDGDVAAQVFLRPGDSVALWLWAGTYTIKVAYGTSWFGEIDLFGKDGSYSQLYNGYDTEFNFKSGYWYELELLSGSGGNVGSDSLSGAEDM